VLAGLDRLARDAHQVGERESVDVEDAHRTRGRIHQDRTLVAVDDDHAVVERLDDQRGKWMRGPPPRRFRAQRRGRQLRLDDRSAPDADSDADGEPDDERERDEEGRQYRHVSMVRSRTESTAPLRGLGYGLFTFGTPVVHVVGAAATPEDRIVLTCATCSTTNSTRSVPASSR
jgi:hypothetical protein